MPLTDSQRVLAVQAIARDESYRAIHRFLTEYSNHGGFLSQQEYDRFRWEADKLLAELDRIRG